MKKYSVDWKRSQVARHGGWAQYHREAGCWKWHTIRNDSEYASGSYLSRKEAEEVER